MRKEKLYEMAEKAAAVEIYHFASENRSIHTDSIKDVAAEFNDISALPEELDCEAELMGAERYDETILANTCVRADDFWENPEDKILVIVLAGSQYDDILRKKKIDKIEIKSVGFDSWGREVFKTAKGSLLCDVNLDRSHMNMNLCAKLDNLFDGEPDYPVKAERFIVVEEFSTSKH